MIFDLLSGEDLMNMAASNKATFVFIRNSQRLMAKILFVINDFARQKRFLNKKAKQGSFLLRCVKISEKPLGAIIFKDILRCLWSVTELELDNIALRTSKNMLQNKIQLPNLRKLKLRSEFLNYI